MDSYIKWLDKAPKILKILFCLPGLGLFWGLYRFLKSCKTNNILHIILGLIMIPVCATAFWVVDLVTVILSGKVLWFD